MERVSKCVLCRPTADGTLTQQPTVLTLRHPAESGINAPWYATAEGIGCGYFKNCANTDRQWERSAHEVGCTGRQEHRFQITA